MPDNLALRMRPKTIDQVIGQEHLVGPGKNHPPHGGSQPPVLHDSIWSLRESAKPVLPLPSLERPSMPFELSMRQLIVKATARNLEEAKFSGGLVLLLDEIHRLDKTKQDFLCLSWKVDWSS